MSYRHGLYGIGAAMLLAAPALGASHLWRFNEVFSNADGTVQFIELLECCGGENETSLDGKWILSDTTAIQFDFPDDLQCIDCTANQHLLLGTAAFAALPGAPTPDFIIPDGLLNTTADRLTYWLYPAAFMEWTGGAVPTGGIDALRIDGTTGVNSPTNFADESGSVVASCDTADLDASGSVGFADLSTMLNAWGNCGLCAPDLDRSGGVGFADLSTLLSRWGPCQ